MKITLLVITVLFLTIFSVSCSEDDGSDDSGKDAQATDDDDIVDDDDNAADDDDDNDNNDNDTFEEPFDPLEPGPYQAGNRKYIFVDENRQDYGSRGDRILLTEVWYPAAKEAAQMPRNTVRDFVEPWGDLLQNIAGLILPPEEAENFSRETGSALDAPIHQKGGPYPLVLLSHGNASIRFAHWSLAEYLASHGYIVVSPDHIGNSVFVTLPDRLVIYNPIHMPLSAVYRVFDMIFLTDVFKDLNEFDPDGIFTGMVDEDKIGAIGHSFGGVTQSEWGILDSRVTAAVDIAAFFIPIYPADFNAALMIMLGGEDRTMG